MRAHHVEVDVRRAVADGAVVVAPRLDRRDRMWWLADWAAGCGVPGGWGKDFRSLVVIQSGDNDAEDSCRYSVDSIEGRKWNKGSSGVGFFCFARRRGLRAS